MLKHLWLLLLLQRWLLNGIKQQVIIAGGGPAGLFAAQALLSRNKEYAVHIVEAKDDPRFASLGPRAYSLGLNLRGQSAFRYFEEKQRCIGMWDEIQKAGVESDSFFLHLGKQKLHLRRPTSKEAKMDLSAPPPTLLIQRNQLCAAMLTYLERQYGNTGRFNTTFDCKLADASFSSRQAILEDGRVLDYDFLIGTDGVQSAVRQAMIKWAEAEKGDGKENVFESEEVVLPGMYKVMVQSCPPSLESDAIHAIEANVRQPANFSLFCIPTYGNRTCALVSWKPKPGNEIPAFLREDASMEDVKTTIAAQYPQFGRPSDEAVIQLRSQRPSEVRTVRCNRYHLTAGRVLLLGDSAHSTGGTLGQGANSALLDVVALDRCLDDANDDLDTAMKLFSERQTPEGLALWQLLQLPPKSPLGIVYQLLQVLFGALRRIPCLRRIIPQPTQNYLSQTPTPFTKIVDMNRFWIRLATKRFRQMTFVPE